MKLTLGALFNIIKISYRTVTVQHVYRHDVEEGQAAKLLAADNFAFTQPCITVTSVLKRCSDRTVTTTHAETRLPHGTNFRIQKKFVEINFCGHYL
jgi:hypothetical protein